MAKHDENKDVKLLGRYAKIDTVAKTITMSKNTIIGIRLLGRLDYLCNHCNYIRLFDNNVIVSKTKSSQDGEESNKKQKKSKEHQLTNKTRKNTKKK